MKRAVAKRAAGSAVALRVSLGQLRAFWARGQGLSGLTAPLPELVAATGWVRTFGGADVYLALRARAAKFNRAALDEAFTAGELRVVPAVRGCMYLVPRAEVPLALSLARDLFDKKAGRELDKAGVRAGELDEVGAGVLQTLRAGPLTADRLRRALPAGLVRSLGERGKKVGLPSPLPPALRLLEFSGRIERTLEGGRLDSERVLWQLPPARAARRPAEAGKAARHVALARLFFGAAGAARAQDFAAWSGLLAAECQAAVAGADLVPVAVEDHEEVLVPSAALPALREGAPVRGAVALGMEDNLLNQHGGPAPLVAADHQDRVVPALPSIERAVTVAEIKHLVARPLLLDGVLIGLWEYDAEAAGPVASSFSPLSAPQRRAAAQACEEAAAFLRDQLGHARMGAIDNPAALKARAARVRKLGTLVTG